MPAFGASCAALGFPSIALSRGLDCSKSWAAIAVLLFPIHALGFPLSPNLFTLYPIPYVVEEQILW